MATFKRKVGDITDMGSEALHRESHRKLGGDSQLMATLDGGHVTVYMPKQYFPVHEGLPGFRPDFPDTAPHIFRCVAVDDDGTTTNACTCGARWTYKQDPEAE